MARPLSRPVLLVAALLPGVSCADGGASPGEPAPGSAAATEGRPVVTTWVERAEDGTVLATALPDCFASWPPPGSVIVLEQAEAPQLVAEGAGLPASVLWFIGEAVVGPVLYPVNSADFDWRQLFPAGSSGPLKVPITIEATDGLGRKASCSYSVYIESLEICRRTIGPSSHLEPLQGSRAFVWDWLGGVRVGPDCEVEVVWIVPEGFVPAAWWDEKCDRPIFLIHRGTEPPQVAAMSSPECSSWAATVPAAATMMPFGATLDHLWLKTSDDCLQARRMSDGKVAGEPFCPGGVLQIVPFAGETLVVRSGKELVTALRGGKVLWTTQVSLPEAPIGATVISPSASWFGVASSPFPLHELHRLDASGKLSGSVSGAGPWSIADDGTVVGFEPPRPGTESMLVARRDGTIAWQVPSPFFAYPPESLVVGDRLWLVAKNALSSFRAFRLEDGATDRFFEVDLDSWGSEVAFRDEFVWIVGTGVIAKLRTDPLSEGPFAGGGPEP